MPILTTHLLQDVIDIAQQAGEHLRRFYQDSVVVHMKEDNTPVTEADMFVSQFLTEKLTALTPDIPILSEENCQIPLEERSRWQSYWLIDPLDGTQQFINRTDQFSILISLVKNGQPVLGVIYVPVKRVLYFAVEGIGAYKCSGIVAPVGKGTTLQQMIKESELMPLEDVRDHFIVVASRSHLSPETETYIADLKKKHGSVELISSGSSIKICLVAEGSADVYPRFAPTMEWDTAAGHAIARAAGMEVYQAGKDEPLRYNKEDLLNPWFIVEPKRKH